MAYGLENVSNATTASLNQPAAKRDTLSSIIENLDPLLNRLDSIVSRAMTCADRINGATPQATVNAEKSPEPNHLIWAAQARRDRLFRIVEALDAEVSRIELGLA